MRKISVLNFLLCFVLGIGINYAQDSTLTYSVSIFASGANDKTPFWLQSNQDGAIPQSGSFLSGQYGIYRIYNPGNPRLFQWSAGAQLITNVSKSSSIFFTDLYLAGKAGPIEISVGQRKGSMGITDTTLTSGSWRCPRMLVPIPKYK